MDEGMLAAVASALSTAATAGGALGRLTQLIRGVLQRRPDGEVVLARGTARPG